MHDPDSGILKDSVELSLTELLCAFHYLKPLSRSTADKVADTVIRSSFTDDLKPLHAGIRAALESRLSHMPSFDSLTIAVLVLLIGKGNLRHLGLIDPSAGPWNGWLEVFSPGQPRQASVVLHSVMPKAFSFPCLFPVCRPVGHEQARIRAALQAASSVTVSIPAGDAACRFHGLGGRERLPKEVRVFLLKGESRMTFERIELCSGTLRPAEYGAEDLILPAEVLFDFTLEAAAGSVFMVSAKTEQDRPIPSDFRLMFALPQEDCELKVLPVRRPLLHDGICGTDAKISVSRFAASELMNLCPWIGAGSPELDFSAFMKMRRGILSRP